MNNISIGRQNYRRRYHKTNTSVPNKQNYLSIAYYLYHILSQTDDYSVSSISFIENLIKSANLYNHAKNILTNKVQKLEKEKLLYPIEENIEEPKSFFDNTDICFKYKIDKAINNEYPIEGVFKDISVDIFRTLLSDKDLSMPDLIAEIFLLDDEIIEKEESKENLFLEKKPILSMISNKTRKEIFSLSKVKFLMEKIELTKNEALYIMAKYTITFISSLESIYEDTQSNDCIIFSNILNISQIELKRMLSHNESLYSYGFIDESGDLSYDLIECINMQSLEPYFAEYLKPLDYSDAYKESSFSVPTFTTKIIKNLLINQDSSSILLYGKPGSGKTEYAKTLAKLTGYKTFIYKNETEITSGAKAISRLTCYLSIKQKDTLIIIDEADRVLQTIAYSPFGPSPTSTKGTVNKMLENNKNKLIWIINHSNQLDESTRRRFTMSYKFDEMPLSMLHNITKSKLAPLNLDKDLSDNLINLLNKYSVTGSSVDNIVKTIKSLNREDNETILKSVKIVLEENAKLLDGSSQRMRESVNSNYNPDIINTSIEAKKIVNMIENATKFSEKNKNFDNGIRMLFYGVSGSGKTELVRYIGEKLNKKILLKRASEILGSFVGETEENIKNAFDQALEEDKILLFDEADSFFADRENARNSWERTMTNEFLTQMEEFPGIVICTTNLKKIMDPAMNRRFHIMVEFKPLQKYGIKTLLSSYFEDYTFTDNQINNLSNLESVTPGDFNSLYSRIRFMDSDNINSQFIINELEKLQEDKNGSEKLHHSIGF